MKVCSRIVLALSFFISLSIAHGQISHATNVDQLVSVLDSVAVTAYVDNWKVSPDLSTAVLNGDPTSAGFDDSKWQNVKLGDEIDVDSCWIRKVVVLPETIFGRPVSGKIGLFVTLDNYGYLWINGKSEGYFPFDKEFLLTDNAAPGMKFVVAIKAVNGGANLHLLGAELRTGGAANLADTLRDLALSLRVGQKILSWSK